MGAKVDYAALKKFRDNLAKLDEKQTAQFTEAAIKELAARLLQKVTLRTPVGVYSKGTGKQGGNLRRNWTIGSVIRDGDIYSIEVINSTEYAQYVEFGHRTVDHKSWVNGRFMLTISEQELKEDASRILNNKLTKFIKEVLNAK